MEAVLMTVMDNIGVVAGNGRLEGRAAKSPVPDGDARSRISRAAA